MSFLAHLTQLSQQPYLELLIKALELAKLKASEDEKALMWAIELGVALNAETELQSLYPFFDKAPKPDDLWHRSTAILLNIHKGQELSPMHLDELLERLEHQHQRFTILRDHYHMAGARPDLRDALRPLSQRLLSAELAQLPGPPIPKAWLEVFERFFPGSKHRRRR